MRTLIIPCGGRKYIDGKPLYLFRHPNGKRMIEWCMAGISPEDFDRILVVLLQEDVDAFGADRILLDELSGKYPIEVVALPEQTSGPADTVYQAITLAKVQGAVVVKDVDNHVRVPREQITQGNFVAGLDLNLWERDIHNLRNKSFLILNEQGNLLDVIEKQFKSDVICLGLYGFKRTEDFVFAYHRLNDSSYPISRLYLSHVISYLIGYSGKVFRYVAAVEFENWSDKRHWNGLQRDYALYFVDLDRVTDATKLLALQNRGASFVGYTVQDECQGCRTAQALEARGIRFLNVVYSSPWSSIKQVLDSDGELDRAFQEL